MHNEGILVEVCYQAEVLVAYPFTSKQCLTRNKSPLHLTRDGITIPGKLSKPGYENIPIASRLGPYPVLVVRRDTKEQVGSLHGMMDYDASKHEW